MIQLTRSRLPWVCACWALASLTGAAARADVKLPAVFGSRMVLQRDLADKVWGKADPGETVTVAIAGQSKTATADANGRWSVALDPLPAGGPHVMTVKGKNEITFDDVMVGEVWLCSGQSNMEWDLGAAHDGDLESLAAKDAGLRFITVPKVGVQDPQDDFKGKWEACSPETARRFSAVGWFFGKTLRETLGVPIGLIDDSWGGSACEAWVRRDLLEKDEKYKTMIARWEQIEKENKNQGMLRGNARPGNIYNGVLKPTIGYGMKGVIWYQGETNAGRAYQYRDLFPLMIQSWRDEWGIGDFPFYYVQLADFMGERAEPSESGWAELREAQTMTMGKLKNTGQAVIIDIGEGKDIHPRNKRDVGLRLARWALAKDYGFHIAYQSPTFKSMTVKDGKAVLTFDNVGNGGLRTFDVREALGFSIAGEDKKFVNAKAAIKGKDTIEVWADGVSSPVAVRYAWADNPICNVYGEANLPLTPFRTDDWKGVTADAQ